MSASSQAGTRPSGDYLHSQPRLFAHEPGRSRVGIVADEQVFSSARTVVYVRPLSSFQRSITGGSAALPQRPRADVGEVRASSSGSWRKRYSSGLAEDRNVVEFLSSAFGRVETALVEEDLRPLAPRPQNTFQMLLAQPVPEVHTLSLSLSRAVSGLHPLGMCVAVGVQSTLGCFVVPEVYRMNAPSSAVVSSAAKSSDPFHQHLVGFPAGALFAPEMKCSRTGTSPRIFSTSRCLQGPRSWHRTDCSP